MTVTNKGRVVAVCDCCKEEFIADGGVNEVWRRPLEQGWVKTVSRNHYCPRCAIGMRQK
jgi:hypothetical protein